MNQGFESAYYITKSNNQTKELYRGNESIEDPFDNRRLTEQFTSEAVKFVRAERDQHSRRVQAMMELALERLTDIEANAIPLGGPVNHQNAEKKRAVWLK